MRRSTKHIYELPEWPEFQWDQRRLAEHWPRYVMTKDAPSVGWRRSASRSTGMFDVTQVKVSYEVNMWGSYTDPPNAGES
jgi:hypothetical protein